MLVPKSVRLAPFLGRHNRSSIVARYGSTMTPVMQRSILLPMSNLLAYKRFTKLYINAPACALTTTSCFKTTEQPSQSSSSPATPSRPQRPQTPTPPNLPDRQQIEKYFFRTLAFIWDTSYWLFVWSQMNFNKFVVQNDTVQLYWRQFLNKIEKSRKD